MESDDSLLDSARKDAAKSFLPAVGYVFFENYVQNPGDTSLIYETDMIYNKVNVMDDGIREVLQYQGSDFFGGAFYTMFWCAQLTKFLEFGLKKVFPESKAAKFVEEQHNHISNAVGFTLLTAHEVSQSANRDLPIDWKDVAAYGLGIFTFQYLPNIVSKGASAIKELFNGNKKDADIRPVFASQQSLPNQYKR